MTTSNQAFGAPGDEPRWTTGRKDGVGTAYSASSRVWYSLHGGHVTEVYYPTIDTPQIRDWRLLVSDSATFLDDEQHSYAHSMQRLCPSLGYDIRQVAPGQRYEIDKRVIADPHLSCVLQRVRIHAAGGLPAGYKVYTFCTPHLNGRGWGNSGHVMFASGRRIIVAERDGRCLALGADRSFLRASIGYVGQSDGATDLADGFTLDWQFDRADDGNIALIGEIDLRAGAEFTLGLAFGDSSHGAITTLLQSLSTPFAEQAKQFETQWRRAVTTRQPLEKYACDGGNLYRASYSLLLAHEDKTFQGAKIASLSIPWGDARTDDDGEGGYHLIWTRDLVECGTALIAAGQTETPLRTLIYLAAAQHADGSFPQNFWTDGRAYWKGIQLDEVAFPILLARRLHVARACSDFDATHMVRQAARYLVTHGPITQQERWEEASGYSPSTLAAIIAACLCAAAFADEMADKAGAALLRDYADWVRSHVVDWTVTNAGTLVKKMNRHFVRLNPAKPGSPPEYGALDQALIRLSSQPPDAQEEYPASDIVDAGFLELVRHGIFAADDPLIVDSLVVVVDRTLKVTTPMGVAWRRYNHDGYGQAAGGLPYVKHGVGRAWPLLAGERAHYELCKGNDVTSFVRDLEQFGRATGMLPEQVWDEADVPETRMQFGWPTGSAAPLLWAHAEYIKLLRSIKDGKPYDQFKDVADRYRTPAAQVPPEFWTFHHPTPSIALGRTLRVCAELPFRLHFSADQWQNVHEEASREVYGIHVVDLVAQAETRGVIRFTFRWTDDDRWEGRDFEVAVR